MGQLGGGGSERPGRNASWGGLVVGKVTFLQLFWKCLGIAAVRAKHGYCVLERDARSATSGNSLSSKKKKMGDWYMFRLVSLCIVVYGICEGYFL